MRSHRNKDSAPGVSAPVTPERPDSAGVHLSPGTSARPGSAGERASAVPGGKAHVNRDSPTLLGRENSGVSPTPDVPGAPRSPGVHGTPRHAPGQLTLSSDERARAVELAEKRRRQRAEAFHSQSYPGRKRRSVMTPDGIDLKAIPFLAKELVRDILAKLSVSRESVLRGVIIAALMVVFALTQTTLFTRLPPFGAVPDLMLSFCVAVAVSEGEHWGAVVSLFAALIITSLGAVSFDPAPLLYLVCAYTAGILSRYYLKQNVITRALFTLGAGLCRAAATFAALAMMSPSYDPGAFMGFAVIPEFFSTLLLAPVIHLIVWASLRVFHRSRAERTGTQS